MPHSIAHRGTQYWATDSQAERSKAVSRAGALVDEGRTLLEKQVGKDLMEATRSLAARGGLGPVPPGALGIPCAKQKMFCDGELHTCQYFTCAWRVLSRSVQCVPRAVNELCESEAP